MKKLGILLLVILTYGCGQKIDSKTFYMNEHFVLIDRSEKERVIGGNTKNIRIWVIQRVIVDGDSVMVGHIDDIDCDIDDIDCDIIITDDLWKKRKVGDTLYFDYIRKDRFELSIVNDVNKDLHYAPDYQSTTTTTHVEEPQVINLNTLEIDRKILEIERQILSLQRELETLKELK